MGEVEQPLSFFNIELSENQAKHVVITSVSNQTPDSFLGNLSTTVDSSANHDAFVFIHGYNVTFDQALRWTAQIAYDLNFSGAPILYSWPSRGSYSGYIADGDSIPWTSDHLATFLEDIYSKSHAKTIHLVAHSMGNRALLIALKKLSDRHSACRFTDMVMAAPDVSVPEFRQDIPQVLGSVHHITLYASSKDEAMVASQKINRYKRAGDTKGGVTIVPPVETIDASNVDTSIVGHSYFSGPTVLSDIYYIFRSGTPASSRARLVELVEMRQMMIGIGRWPTYNPIHPIGCPISRL